MNKTQSSDSNPIMVANEAFDSILEHITTSNLNFQLQMSPFSASISLKKSPVKDKAGTPLWPQVRPSKLSQTVEATIAALAAKNLQLEADFNSLRKEHTDCVDDCEGAYRRIKLLESQPAFQTEIKLESDSVLCTELEEKNCALETLQIEIKQLKKENSEKNKTIESQKVDVYDLKLAHKIASETSNRLNKVLSDLKIKSKKEKHAILKQNKAEIKYWRKELGEETRAKIKLEEKLEEKLNESNEHPFKTQADDISGLQHRLDPTVPLPQSPPSTSEETLCSICASPILNYVPRYFHGEQYNPACDKCHDTSWMSENSTSSDETFLEVDSIATTDDILPFTRKGFNPHHITTLPDTSSSSSNCLHNQQCIIRQPFPPPIPALTPLVNEYSLYHTKTMAGELDWGSTCWYCMRIEYEKYGCDSCVWIKCFGELHGYPDMAPHDYKKFL